MQTPGRNQNENKNRGETGKEPVFVSYVCWVGGHCNGFRVMAIPIASRSER
jgi:hypothetical protein